MYFKRIWFSGNPFKCVLVSDLKEQFFAEAVEGNHSWKESMIALECQAN